MISVLTFGTQQGPEKFVLNFSSSAFVFAFQRSFQLEKHSSKYRNLDRSELAAGPRDCI